MNDQHVWRASVSGPPIDLQSHTLCTSTVDYHHQKMAQQATTKLYVPARLLGATVSGAGLIGQGEPQTQPGDIASCHDEAAIRREVDAVRLVIHVYWTGSLWPAANDCWKARKKVGTCRARRGSPIDATDESE